MKLPEHVDIIREKISKAFNNQFSRLGFGAAKMVDIDKIPVELHPKRNKIEQLVKSHEGETGNYIEAREKALEELTFTLFNRLAAIKVMEALQLFPPIVTKQAEHGGRSLGHKVWLEQNPAMRQEELEGLREYFKYEFNKLGDDIPLFHKNYPYAFIPFVIEFGEIIDAINNIELDGQIDNAIWQSDDILGWLYESYNNAKKQAHKDSGDKTEYHKVSLQSQVYTPRWVVEFLVHNSLGKLYLEMYPDSAIKDLYKIANAPKSRVREPKALHLLRLIDPASGSGNFLLYAFAFFYALYLDQIENYDADYEIEDIPKLIIENNLYGIDLDDRAAQLAQLGLWIKAKQKNRNTKALHFNIVSSDFYLPAFEEVLPIFQSGIANQNQQKIVSEIWEDLQQAYKFGSLVKVDEKLSVKLHGLVSQEGISLFGKQELEEYKRFTADFFKNLETAVAQFAEKQGVSFLTDKTKDAITFLKLITQKYDVATANPPYTDSADFGPDLKKFIDTNYSKPYKFNSNLYATFIKRCFELTNDNGKVAMIHPLTFMYIKTFEDVRKYILTKSKIDSLIELGLGGIFLTTKVDVDVTAYIIDKNKINYKSTFFMNLQEYKGLKIKRVIFDKAYNDYLLNITNKHNYDLDQEKFKIIETWPFIYWISDGFRNKFTLPQISEFADIKSGLATANNDRFLRYWWEVDKSTISNDHKIDKLKWVRYAKGGDYNKWAGNLWLVLNWGLTGEEMRSTGRAVFRNQQYYFKQGITYSATSSKGTSFRKLPENCVYDVKGASAFIEGNIDYQYILALFNSKISSYIIDCLNNTVETQVGDIKRVPFASNNVEQIMIVKTLVDNIIYLKEIILSYKFQEPNFIKSPLLFNFEKGFNHSIKLFFNYENYLNAYISIMESMINEAIFISYELSNDDKEMVITKEGKSIGELPVSLVAKNNFLADQTSNIDFTHKNINEYILNLPCIEFSLNEREKIENDFNSIYNGSNSFEEFCTRHKVNPINVWYWFKESNIIPKERMNDLAMEFLADLIKDILMEDDDGLIPLVPNAGEKMLIDRLEGKFLELGFNMAQYSSFDKLLSKELNNYLLYFFFNKLSNALNMFRNLPMTPFIWHLTSGPEQGFDCYIIIYKWNRDKLLSLRSVYIEHRERALVNRQSDLASDTSAKAQNEKDKIYKQLKEIESFKAKIDELLAEGYNPILDDGVGKNIAPLQKIGMLAYEVLNAGQLKKYLNANW
jgi:hypothetical protein